LLYLPLSAQVNLFTLKLQSLDQPYLILIFQIQLAVTPQREVSALFFFTNWIRPFLVKDCFFILFFFPSLPMIQVQS
jgi:hypothetical protein